MEVPVDDAADRALPAAHDAAAARTRDVATGVYYDRLSRWTARVSGLGYGGGRETLTAHRALADPRASGRPTFTRLHDVLADALPSPLRGHVLDAGCGLGGTMLDLAARGPATFVGITLSAQQAAVARRAAAEAGLEARVDVRVGSYDEPPAGPFDAVIAIESLAHSAQPGATVAALAARLAPGGRLVVVDDMPTVEARGTYALASFQAGWRLPVLLSAAELAAAFERCGLVPAGDRDLTCEVRPRTLRRIAQLETLNRALHRVLPSGGIRELLDSYRGGLALERLYRRGLMNYRLVVARKPG
ncbi:MAG TPA: methyltransferase domain-containing protein [Gammaproteobacteria bacterium]|nr:methyltransferase domain-containing protein [Gammaproteobacteria bacterium]